MTEKCEHETEPFVEPFVKCKKCGKILLDLISLPKIIERERQKAEKDKLSLEKKDLMKENCRNCGQFEATETWRVCSICGDILQDYLIETYKFNRKIISKIKKFIDRCEKNWDDYDECCINTLKQLLKEIGDE